MRGVDGAPPDDGSDAQEQLASTGPRARVARAVEARLVRALHEISVSAGRTLDPAELVEVVAEHACELLEADAVALYILDEGARVLVPIYSNDEHTPRGLDAELSVQRRPGVAGEIRVCGAHRAILSCWPVPCVESVPRAVPSFRSRARSGFWP